MQKNDFNTGDYVMYLPECTYGTIAFVTKFENDPHTYYYVELDDDYDDSAAETILARSDELEDACSGFNY